MSDMRLGCSKLTNTVFVGKMVSKIVNGKNILISHAKKHDVTNDFWLAAVQMLGDPDLGQSWITVISAKDDESEYEFVITKRKKRENK